MEIRPVGLHVVAGTNLQATLLLSEDGAPLDLSGADLSLEVAPGPGRPPGFTFEGEPYLTVNGTEGAATRVDINVPPEETRLFTGGHYRWEWRAFASWGVGQRIPIGLGPLMRNPVLVQGDS